MKGTIVINGLIGDCGKETGLFLIDIIKAVKAQPDATEFDVHITSDGGNVEEGFKIYDYLVGIPQTINMIGKVRLASIATVIFFAGDNLYLEPSCAFMIHQPTSGIEKANADMIIEYGNFVKESEKLMVGFYAEQMNIPNDTIAALLASETWLKATDCYALGFAKEYVQTSIVARTYDSNDKLNFL